MFHLPKDKEKVWVWPEPSRPVLDHMPADGAGVFYMDPVGRLVEWDGFRYRQYLEGDLHFHDPRSEKEQTKAPTPEHHEDFKLDPTDAHSPELVAQLKAIALKDGGGLYYEEAKKEEAERLAAKAQADAEEAVAKQAAAKADAEPKAAPTPDPVSPKPAADAAAGTER